MSEWIDTRLKELFVFGLIIGLFVWLLFPTIPHHYSPHMRGFFFRLQRAEAETKTKYALTVENVREYMSDKVWHWEYKGWPYQYALTGTGTNWTLHFQPERTSFLERQWLRLTSDARPHSLNQYIISSPPLKLTIVEPNGDRQVVPRPGKNGNILENAAGVGPVPDRAGGRRSE